MVYVQDNRRSIVDQICFSAVQLSAPPTLRQPVVVAVAAVPSRISVDAQMKICNRSKQFPPDNSSALPSIAGPHEYGITIEAGRNAVLGYRMMRLEAGPACKHLYRPAGGKSHRLRPGSINNVEGIE